MLLPLEGFFDNAIKPMPCYLGSPPPLTPFFLTGAHGLGHSALQGSSVRSANPGWRACGQSSYAYQGLLLPECERSEGAQGHGKGNVSPFPGSATLSHPAFFWDCLSQAQKMRMLSSAVRPMHLRMREPTNASLTRAKAYLRVLSAFKGGASVKRGPAQRMVELLVQANKDGRLEAAQAEVQATGL